MSDPLRWKDGGGPDGAARLLRTASPPRPMTAAERARTAARVAQSTAGAGVGGAASGALWGKGLAVIAGLGIAAAALRASLPAETTPELPVAPLGEPLPATAATEFTQGVSEIGTAGQIGPELGAPSRTAVPAVTAFPPAADPTSGAESPSTGSARRQGKTAIAPTPGASPSGSAVAADALLEEAQSLERVRARLGGDPAGALAALADHQRRFPRGQLGAEREYLTIDALSRLGRRDEARARARAFLARYPSSPYAVKLPQAAPAERPPGEDTNP